MPKSKKAAVKKLPTRSNKGFLVFAIVFAVVGVVFLIKSLAAPAAPTGALSIRPSSTIQEPMILDWSFNEALKSLERPHINLGCFRDQNGDGMIDTSSWSSPDLAYGSQSYLYNSPSTYGQVVVTQDGKTGSKGYITIDLLSGSNKLVNEPSASKTVKCSAELRVWDGNLRQETSGITVAKSQTVTLTDTRQ